MALTVEDGEKAEREPERALTDLFHQKVQYFGNSVGPVEDEVNREACLGSANVVKPRVGISLCKILDKRKSLVWCPMTAATLTQDSDCDYVVSVQNWQL